MSDKDNPPSYTAATSGGYSGPTTQFNTPQPNYGLQPQAVYNIPQQGSYNATVTVAQPAPGAMYYQSAPYDYTTQAWIACLCCFWPTGLFAILKANESRDALARGDVVGANSAANSARQMVRISWAVGIASMIFAVVFVVVYIVVIMNTLYQYSD